MGAVLKSKMSGSPPEEPAPVAPAAPVVASSGSIPSVDSADFESFIESEENLLKWIESAEK